MSKINQTENFNANFGYCLRSSSIFYIPPNPVKTKIILSNYWHFKNNISVFILANYRNMNGELIERKELKFNEKNVFEIYPKNFTGSCEIETFSSNDLRIPYSAIMVVYETEDSISMVHSYSRVYSNLEVEDKKTICDGHEGCWILKDTDVIESFGVIHNGFTTQKEQIMNLTITNHRGDIKNVKIPTNAINPYETLVIKPRSYFKDLVAFLNGKDGTCAIHFELSNSFTRMLLGWQNKDISQLQVTHSNFDYSSHETDFIDNEGDNFAYMAIPKLKDKKVSVIIYPDRSPGNYFLNSQFINKTNIPKNLFSFESAAQELVFYRDDDKLPSRIVTALKVESSNENILSAECSLGVTHSKVPGKRFHWGLWSAKFDSHLIITSKQSIWGDPKGESLCLRLYSQNHSKVYEKSLKWDEISDNKGNSILQLKNIFEETCIDQENYMYVSIFCNYPGFVIYTTLQKGNSFTIEHTF